MKLVYGNDYYDKIQALVDGKVKAEGVELVSVRYPAPELFFRVLKYAEFDLAEMSFTSFLVALGNRPDYPYLAIPVFPIRRFFHTDIVCSVASGIKGPQDLPGKRFGLPEYQMSLAIWTRAALERDFGIAPSQISWFEERAEELNRNILLGLSLPPDVRIARLPADKSLSGMLLTGELDAAVGVGLQTVLDRSGDTSLVGRAEVRLLFDPLQESTRFFKAHAYAPPNHVIVIKRRILQRHPWVAMSLFKGYEAAKADYYRRLSDMVANTYRRPDVPRSTGLLGLKQLVEEERSRFGPDLSPYGLRANGQMIADCIQTLYSQGFLPRLLEPESAFAEGTLHT